MSPQRIARKTKVILFTDIHHFARILVSKELDSVLFLQKFYEDSGDEIVKRGGKIIKYMGDTIYALFPDGSELAAVECAEAMRKAYDALVAKWSVTIETELEVGIGFGEVYIGEFGHKSLKIEDAFGEAVCNTAMMRRYRGIAVTEEIKNRIRGKYRVEALPDFQPKWRPEPIKTWAVIETDAD
ncbi:MAG TPA: adenylate/guanylate cyclase domain-containing protein [bacterium]|nr:adenylate/guanylate cyclase domain-containing protein [bacterium]